MNTPTGSVEIRGLIWNRPSSTAEYPLFSLNDPDPTRRGLVIPKAYLDPLAQKILKDVPLPKEMNVRYCVAMGLATRLDADNFDKAWKFLEKMPGEVQTLTIKLAHKRDKTITRSPAFSKWAIANQAAFSMK